MQINYTFTNFFLTRSPNFNSSDFEFNFLTNLLKSKELYSDHVIRIYCDDSLEKLIVLQNEFSSMHVESYDINSLHFNQAPQKFIF